ncbi:flagellar hook-length control protein FliK [Azospirillum soli]|uniref:flagellar hook-length control protein FliK n=1 Tax=Azospirillum soli TaxID=1304799 RepID=UPI001AE9D704|nr:flagellar hook-length control protein FliK [Azospirillum soli]MBP2311918.1 flagellar hook-length control protein FliK [Azospirillum soli]
MEIQSNATAASLFESLSQKEGAGAKGDMFASMMNRILTEAANRKREQAQADAEAADRKAPVRADRPKPRHADVSAQPPRAPEKVEPPPAKERPEPKAEAKDNAPPRAEKAEAPQRDPQAPKADKAERAAKKDATDGSRKTDDTQAKDAPADQTAAGADEAPQDGNAKVAADGDVPSDAPQELAKGDELIVIDAELTITETTIEVITDEGAFALAMTEQTATLDIEGAEAGAEQAAEALKAITGAGTGDADAAQPAAEVDPAVQLAAAQAALAAQAAAQTPQDAATAGADASKAAEAVHAVKPGEAVPLETVPGDLAADLAADALSETDDDAPLPGNLAELAAAKAKGSDKSGAKGDGDAGTKGDGQNQGGNPALAQVQTQPAQTAESAKSTAETAFAAAVATAADVVPTAKPAEAAPTSTHPAIAAMEAPRGAAGVDEPQATAHLRPSRGSAAMPQGVHEQMAVHIQKNVSDGNDQFTINLRPVEMGRIDIRLEIAADGRVSAMVAVEKAQTLELLQRDSRNLERALQDAGLKADSNSLNFSLRGEGGNPFQDDARQGGTGRRGRRGGGGGGEVEDVTAAYTATLAPGRVDIHA